MIFCQLGGQGEPLSEAESLSEDFVHREQMEHLQHGFDPQSVLTVPSRGSEGFASPLKDPRAFPRLRFFLWKATKVN